MPAVGMEFSQTGEELLVKFAVDAELKTSDIKCIIKAQHLCVSIRGETKFDDGLIGKIDPEESNWQVEGSKNGERNLQITLVKLSKTQWKCLGKSEAEEIRANAGDVHLYTVNELNPDDNREDAMKNEHDERVLEAEFLELRKTKGLQDVETLKKFFQLFDNSIQLYRLNKLQAYLNDIVPLCRQRSDEYKIKAIQAYAFVLWKQSHFREALPIFHEMEDMLGQNGALCENIAHTYNSLGNYGKAEEYFSAALKFCQNDESASSQKGGVLLGLGLVRERQGNARDAEKIVRQSYEFYKRRGGGQLNSLQAKAGLALAKIIAKLGKEEESERLLVESKTCYEVTCGAMSPLTCSGYQELATLQWKRGKREESRKNFAKAYEIVLRKDHLDIIQIMEVHNGMLETLTQGVDSIDRKEFKEFRPLIDEGLKRLKEEPKQDGNTAVYYKLAGEFLSWCSYYEDAKKELELAKSLFGVETSCDCTKLIIETTQMISYCERCLNGQQESPMELPVTEKGGREDHDEPFVEEVVD